MNMDIHVYDTYVKAKDGHTMHFDVITDKQDHDQAIAFAKEWLSNKSIYEKSPIEGLSSEWSLLNIP